MRTIKNMLIRNVVLANSNLRAIAEYLECHIEAQYLIEEFSLRSVSKYVF